MVEIVALSVVLKRRVFLICPIGADVRQFLIQKACSHPRVVSIIASVQVVEWLVGVTGGGLLNTLCISYGHMHGRVSVRWNQAITKAEMLFSLDQSNVGDLIEFSTQ
jgi:hypothetical protein